MLPIFLNQKYKTIRGEISKNLFPLLLKTHCFKLSFLILSMHYLIFYLKIKQSPIYSLYDLEQSFSEHSELLVLFLSISFTVIWNFYLFIFLYILKVSFTTSTSPLLLTLPELLFNNPFSFMGMLYLTNRDNFFNSIDLTFELIILINYFTISKMSFAYFGSIQLKTMVDVKKEIVLLCALTFINVLFSFLIYELISQSNSLLLFIILGKGVYYELKLLETSVHRISKFNFTQKTNEEKETLLISKLKSNFHLELLTTIFIYYQFTAMFIYSDQPSLGTSLGTFILLIIQGYSAVRKYQSYEAIKDFIRNLDQGFENSRINSNQCYSCKESMTKGKKLKCGHVFHLICIEKIFEMGINKCLVCNRVIEVKQCPYFSYWNNLRKRKVKFGVNLLRTLLIRVEIDYDVWNDNTINN